VAGAPRAAAVRWIARQEGLDRGWYAGPIGFVNAQGGGEFVVALRSALLCGEEARLFAGAGIVEGSQPDAELRETRLKLRALLAPLLEI
jgi:isochorismate synthase EntC